MTAQLTWRFWCFTDTGGGVLQDQPGLRCFQEPRQVSSLFAGVWKRVLRLTVKLASHMFVALNKSSVGRSRLPHPVALFNPSFSCFHRSQGCHRGWCAGLMLGPACANATHMGGARSGLSVQGAESPTAASSAQPDSS